MGLGCAFYVARAPHLVVLVYTQQVPGENNSHNHSHAEREKASHQGRNGRPSRGRPHATLWESRGQHSKDVPRAPPDCFL